MSIIDIIISYINSKLLDDLIKDNAEFFTKNRRSWTVGEFAIELKKRIETNFEPYTAGTTAENTTIRLMFADIPYHAIADIIYTSFYNKTLLYRSAQGDLVIDISEPLEQEYQSTETEFFENPLLNYENSVDNTTII